LYDFEDLQVRGTLIANQQRGIEFSFAKLAEQSTPVTVGQVPDPKQPSPP
jgi:hypothetical protein